LQSPRRRGRCASYYPASGQVGQMLARYFQERGHRVAVLTRGPYAAPWQTIYWDGEHPGPWIEALEGCRRLHPHRRPQHELPPGPRKPASSSTLPHPVYAGYCTRSSPELADPPKVWMNASASAIQTRIPGPDGADLPLQEERLEADQRSEWMCRGQRDATSPLVWHCDWKQRSLKPRWPAHPPRGPAPPASSSQSPCRATSSMSFSIRPNKPGWRAKAAAAVRPWIHETDYARRRRVSHRARRSGRSVPLAAPNPLPNRDSCGLARGLGDAQRIPARPLPLRLGAWLMGSNADLRASKAVAPCRAD